MINIFEFYHECPDWNKSGKIIKNGGKSLQHIRVSQNSSIIAINPCIHNPFKRLAKEKDKINRKCTPYTIILYISALFFAFSY